MKAAFHAALLGVIYILFVSVSAVAIDIAPLLPPGPGGSFAPPPLQEERGAEQMEASETDPDAVVVQQILGIRFERFHVSLDGTSIIPTQPGTPDFIHPDRVGKSVLNLSGVENEVPALEEDLSNPASPLRQSVEKALAGPLTWRVVDELLVQATKTARAYGWSLAQSLVPEQELTKNPLRVVVVPVHLESTDVTGAKWSRTDALRQRVEPLNGRIVHFPDLNAAIAPFDRHPFRSAKPVLSPGDETGTTKLELQVQESKPWQVFSEYESTSSRNSGRGRLSAGFIAAVPWRTDDIVTMRYSVDDKFQHLDSISAMYRAALPWDHYLTLTGLMATSETNTNEFFSQKTRDSMIRAAYSVPLPEWKGWTHEIEAGVEWRRSKEEMYFDGFGLIRQNTYDAAPLFLGWSGRRPDRMGQTSLSGQVKWSPGDWFGGRMDRRSYENGRLGADARWTSFEWDIRRDWRLPKGIMAVQRFWGQLSSSRLPGVAQFYLGGNRSIRGYRESEWSGDAGVGTSMELYSPALRLPLPVKGENAEGRPHFSARLLGFWDWGQIYNHAPLEFGENGTRTLSGAGLGVRLGYGSWVDVRVDYGWRLHKTGIPQDDRSGRWHIMVRVSF